MIASAIACERAGERARWATRRDGRARSPCYPDHGEVAERLMAALLKSAESKDFVGSNPTLSAIVPGGPRR